MTRSRFRSIKHPYLKVNAIISMVAITIAASIFTAPPASAGYYHQFGWAYVNANFKGARFPLSTAGYEGPCDVFGYTVKLPFYPTSTNYISSVDDSYFGDKCNYVVFYRDNGTICGNGKFDNFAYVGNACNDQIRKFRIKYDSRLPARSK